MWALNGRALTGCIIQWPTSGPWRVTATVEGEAPLPKAASLALYGRTLVGSVVDDRPTPGGRRVVIYPGLGRWLERLPTVHYRNTTAGRVLADLAAELGVVVAGNLPTDVATARLEYWTRAAEDGASALQALAEPFGWAWRVDDAGALWMGDEAASSAVNEEDFPRIQTYDDGVEVRRVMASLALRPGQTIGGVFVRAVNLLWALDGLGADGPVLQLRLDDGLGSNGAKRGAAREVWPFRERRLLGVYGGSITTWRDDYTVDVVPDDPTLAGRGLVSVPLFVGFPGRVRLEGAGGVFAPVPCLLVFREGDPRRPAVVGIQQVTSPAGYEPKKPAIAEEVDANFEAIKSLFTEWVVAPNDGGAALKTAAEGLSFGETGVGVVEVG